MKKIKQKIVVIAVALLIPSFSFASETLILYYTRTETNKIIAEYIQSQIQDATIAEITTKDDRSGFFGFITCLFDQWFDREADINELTIKPEDYSTIIMCSPIWMQNLSSPARTFIKQSDLKDKPFYLFITYGGRLNDEKKKTIEKWLVGQGVALKGVYGSAVGGKTEEEITKQTKDHLRSANLVSEESM